MYQLLHPLIGQRSMLNKLERFAPRALKKLQIFPRSRNISRVSLMRLAGAVTLGILGYQSVVRYGRLLLRIKALEDHLYHLVGRSGGGVGITTGRVVIEDFDLPEIRGGRMSLSQWQGQTLLLVFFDPASAPCQRLVPSLAALTAQAESAPVLPIIISTGTVESNLRVLNPRDIRCPILLQDQWELATLFDVTIAPMAYLVDGNGRIASVPAVGASAIFALMADDATTPAPRISMPYPLASPAPEYAPPTHEGLPVGTRAPDVRLPRLGGGEISLSGYRGSRVLLVFWDPRYGPCMPLATRLEALHHSFAEPALLMISRGGEEQNREVVAELGLTFPIGLQRYWEVSREYAMFATPVCYLIDETGTIIHDVVIGAESILSLATAEMQGHSRI